IISLLPGVRTSATERPPVSIFLGGYVIAMTIFMSSMFAFDFRGDIERIDVLKALPISSAAMVIGQLPAPVLFISIMQALALTVIAFGSNRQCVGLAFCFCMPLTVPFNFLLFGIGNLLFLLFPTRTVNASPGDFQAMGRYVLLNLAKFITLSMAAGLAA